MSTPERKNRRCSVYLMRHGDSRQDSVRRFIGQSDHPLNDTGRAQSEWWRRELSRIPFSHICCSDLKRSMETAQIIGQRLSVPLTILPGLREIDLGSWDGMPVSEVQQLYPQEYDVRGKDLAGFRPPGGESFIDLSDRVTPILNKLIQHSEGNLLIIGHAGVNRVILCQLLGIPLANIFRLEQGYGCLNILEYFGGCRVVSQMNIQTEAISYF
ncbi:MAG: alpha-ribazole phosphatase [Geobacteraceae bacterium]|nr:alpha-ribazole phosphatase [Geobacteraceae bacterium]